MKSLLPTNKNSKTGKEKVRINRRLITFLFCLLISSFFWIMLSLAKEYTIVVSFPVRYINFPDDKVVANQLTENIDLEIKSTGLNILMYQINQDQDTLFIDIKGAKATTTPNNYFIVPNSRIEKIAGQFNKDIEIMNVFPDTLLINYNPKKTKKVPVIANIKIDFDPLYQQTDSIKLSPSFVIVSGDEELVDRINFAATQPVHLKNVSDSVSIDLDILQTPQLDEVELTPSSITARINVTKFTEANIELPIEVENLPASLKMKTFPNVVSIKYNVAFEDFKKIDPSQFRAVVDYSKIETGSNKLKIKLIKYPKQIRAIKIFPEKAEYIIRKN